MMRSDWWRNFAQTLERFFHVLFPDKNITRKIHELIFNVPLFLRRFGTIGMLSEEEGESLHASINCELRQLVAVRDPNKKWPS